MACMCLRHSRQGKLRTAPRQITPYMMDIFSLLLLPLLLIIFLQLLNQSIQFVVYYALPLACGTGRNVSLL